MLLLLRTRRHDVFRHQKKIDFNILLSWLLCSAVSEGLVELRSCGWSGCCCRFNYNQLIISMAGSKW